MVVYVANPLYDAVFKYLMEDERIAKTLLSALLKKKVVDVKMRRNEYANLTRRELISMFRIDFAATILDDDGKQHLMLIELQKTWLPTETLRFRRYLALQYNNEENIVSDKGGKYAIPMVAVYLLGHRVGNIQAPVVYVNHKAFDYDGHEVMEGMPDPFVESLQHDSIIVQIPLLHGQVNNRLEQLLSVFDQTRAADNNKVIKLDDSQFVNDNDMGYILHRLQSAAADPEMRVQMNAEDEFFKELESRDTAIMERDRMIQAQEGKIQAQEGKIQAQEGKIQAQEGKIQAQEGKIQAQEGKIQAQSEILRSMIVGLQKSGMTIEGIAKMTGKTEDEIIAMIQHD